MLLRFIFLAVFLLVAGFIEFIVFNEEVLLALCFLAFVFFSNKHLGDSVFSTFDQRAIKFESDIISVFDSKHKMSTHNAQGILLLKESFTSLALFETSIGPKYNSFCFADRVKEPMLSMATEYVTALLQGTALGLKASLHFIQQKNTQCLVYPFIFKFCAPAYKIDQ
jgi:hypothetical protein